MHCAGSDIDDTSRVDAGVTSNEPTGFMVCASHVDASRAHASINAAPPRCRIGGIAMRRRGCIADVFTSRGARARAR
jgi:hypothetical protein